MELYTTLRCLAKYKLRPKEQIMAKINSCFSDGSISREQYIALKDMIL